MFFNNQCIKCFIFNFIYLFYRRDRKLLTDFKMVKSMFWYAHSASVRQVCWSTLQNSTVQDSTVSTFFCRNYRIVVQNPRQYRIFLIYYRSIFSLSLLGRDYSVFVDRILIWVPRNNGKIWITKISMNYNETDTLLVWLSFIMLCGTRKSWNFVKLYIFGIWYS